MAETTTLLSIGEFSSLAQLSVSRLRDIGVGVSAIPVLLAARGTPAWTRALELQREVLAG